MPVTITMLPQYSKTARRLFGDYDSLNPSVGQFGLDGERAQKRTAESCQIW